MSYYVIKILSDKKTAYCVESPSPRPDEFRAGDYRTGKMIDYNVPPLKIKTDKDHGKIFLDVIPTQGLEFIISKKLVDVFKGIGLKNLQYFPIIVTDYFSKKKYDYWVCNVIGKIPCLDFKSSDIKFDKDGKIFILNRMALDQAAIEAFNNSKIHDDRLSLFRLEEHPRYMIAHESVRDCLINAGIQGIEFRKPEESGDFL